MMWVIADWYVKLVGVGVGLFLIWFILIKLLEKF